MDIVHLATHANSNSDAPDKSYIAFYEEEDQLEEDENLLYLDDLSKLYMPAKMVVLSACETGLGKIFKGEGAMSLANACFYAGAQSVVATLWSVQDNTTYEIIVSFYDYLQKGYSKDKALQAAQLDFINSHSKDFHHPYYWAGFTVIGNNEPLVFAKSNPLQKYGSIGLISITLIFAVNFYRNRKKSAKEAA
jgi:CHAT domain-containing protein